MLQAGVGLLAAVDLLAALWALIVLYTVKRASIMFESKQDVVSSAEQRSNPPVLTLNVNFVAELSATMKQKGEWRLTFRCWRRG